MPLNILEFFFLKLEFFSKLNVMSSNRQGKQCFVFLEKLEIWIFLLIARSNYMIKRYCQF